MVLTVNIKVTFFLHFFYAFSNKKVERVKMVVEHNGEINTLLLIKNNFTRIHCITVYVFCGKIYGFAGKKLYYLGNIVELS